MQVQVGEGGWVRGWRRPLLRLPFSLEKQVEFCFVMCFCLECIYNFVPCGDTGKRFAGVGRVLQQEEVAAAESALITSFGSEGRTRVGLPCTHGEIHPKVRPPAVECENCFVRRQGSVCVESTRQVVSESERGIFVREERNAHRHEKL